MVLRVVPPAVEMDVSDVSSIERAFDQAEEAMGGEPIDVLINNAGIATPNIALRITPDEWDSLMDTNLRYAHPLPFPTLPYPSVVVCIWLGHLRALKLCAQGSFLRRSTSGDTPRQSEPTPKGETRAPPCRCEVRCSARSLACECDCLCV